MDNLDEKGGNPSKNQDKPAKDRTLEATNWRKNIEKNLNRRMASCQTTNRQTDEVIGKRSDGHRLTGGASWRTMQVAG